MADVEEAQTSGFLPVEPPGSEPASAKLREGDGDAHDFDAPGAIAPEELSVEPPPIADPPSAPRRAPPPRDRLRGAVLGARERMASTPSSEEEGTPSTPLAARRAALPRDIAMRPAPALARAPIPHHGRDVDAPAAPRGVLGLGGRASNPTLTDEAHPPATRPPLAPHLSPRMTAVFGGIFGLAMVTSIVALLIQTVPPRDDRAMIAGSAAASAGAAPEPVRVQPKKRQRVAVPGPWRIAELDKDPTVLIASATMDRRSFVDALADKNVPKAQAYRVMKAFEDVRKFDKSGRKDKFTVAMERSTKRVKAFEYEVSPSEIYQAREGSDGLLSGAKLDLKIAAEETTGAFYVGSDVVASYQWAGLEDGILPALDEALSGHITSESFEEGSIVRFIAIEETALGLFARYKQITAVEYRPADPTGKPIRTYAFKGEQSHGYFDEHGKQFGGGWQSPVPGAIVTSRFNPKRLHPVLHTVMPHTGTDFRAPTGTPIYSAYRGVVDSAGPLGPCGNAVTIQHANGVTTGYCHMSRFASGLKAGDHVATHQIIGYAGATGRATGPHLHFFAKKDGKFFDAQTLDLDGEHVLPGVDRAAFLATKAELDRRLEAIPLPEPPPEKPKPKDAAPAASVVAAVAEVPSPSPSPPSGAPRQAAPVATNVALDDGGIHPGALVEDDQDDDGEGDLGGTPPAASGAASAKPPAE